jgi:hypothetical protein
MKSSHTIDLADFEVESIETYSSLSDITLQNLSASHMLTETGASSVAPCPVFLCSCCCCC